MQLFSIFGREILECKIFYTHFAGLRYNRLQKEIFYVLRGKMETG